MKTTSISSSPPRGRSSVMGVLWRPAKCPTCGSQKIAEVVSEWSGEFDNRRYSVPPVRRFECPKCGERVYPPEAIRQIQAASPAFRRRRPGQKSA